jgi:hypothetical protein
MCINIFKYFIGKSLKGQHLHLTFEWVRGRYYYTAYLKNSRPFFYCVIQVIMSVKFSLITHLDEILFSRYTLNAFKPPII